MVTASIRAWKIAGRSLRHAAGNLRGCATTQSPGGFFHAVSCFRERWTSRCHYFVHVGNCIVLLAINQKDMLHLRTLSVTASCCGIAYNLLQPTPLWAPAAWGAFFISCHLYYITHLLRDRVGITMDPDHEAVYERAFMPHGFTPRQFLKILQAASGRIEEASCGAYICRQGEAKKWIHYLLEGEAMLIDKSEDKVVNILPGKGGWLGEFFDPAAPEDHWDAPRAHQVSFKCIAHRCRFLTLEISPLHKAILASDLAEAATRAEVSDLWGKLHGSHHEHRRNTYSAMLELAVADGKVDAKEVELLEKWKTRHGIPEDDHQVKLAELGWTTEDFFPGFSGVKIE
ncbi:unnamed protein product [Symbiodinium natans]|uniref:Cyclic nucleotide-binding domain-containing protein n=1 Tax=Symbiodinium natans TaxID=878477 RepID=A0A812U746_9DINO|nr:unnamed protein product [Symbiodinium natans]